jgi:hypothetical protein
VVDAASEETNATPTAAATGLVMIEFLDMVKNLQDCD